MKIEDGKIIEASEGELYGYYLERHIDDMGYSFEEYKNACVRKGVKLVGGERCSSCGKTWKASDMERINTGRRTQLLCPRCYRRGHNDTTCFITDQADKLRKEGRKKKKVKL